MQNRKKEYNFLVVGKAGAGKSCLAKFLTGDQNIQSRASMNPITKQIQYFKCLDQTAMQLGYSFNIIDIPGLDKIQERQNIRSEIFQKITTNNLEIDGILYLINLTQRDALDPRKVLNFIQRLPWKNCKLKQKIIPIFTHYDILLLEGQKQIKNIINEHKNFLIDNEFEKASQKNILWAGDLQKLQKMKKMFQKQLENQEKRQIQELVLRVYQSGQPLNISMIDEYERQQKQYVKQKLIQSSKKQQLQAQHKTLKLKIPIHIQKNVKNNESAKLQAGIGTAGMITAGGGIAGSIIASKAIAATTAAITTATSLGTSAGLATVLGAGTTTTAVTLVATSTAAPAGAAIGATIGASSAGGGIFTTLYGAISGGIAGVLEAGTTCAASGMAFTSTVVQSSFIAGAVAGGSAATTVASTTTATTTALVAASPVVLPVVITVGAVAALAGFGFLLYKKLSTHTDITIKQSFKDKNQTI